MDRMRLVRMKMLAARWLSAAVVAVGLAGSASTAAEQGPATTAKADAIGRALKAMAAVEIRTGPKPDDVQIQTAVCVDPIGTFMALLPGNFQTVTIILNPGTAAQKAYPARVWPSVPHTAVRLMSITGATGLSALDFSADWPFATNTPVSVLGMDIDPAKHVLSPPKPMPFTLVQVVATGAWVLQPVGATELRPSANGGVFVNDAGRLCGAVHGPPNVTTTGSIHRFLTRQRIEFDPPPIPYARRFDKRDFPLRVHAFGTAKDRIAVELRLGSLRTGMRAFAALPVNATATVPPNSYKAGGAPLAAEDRDPTCTVDYNVTVRVDEHAVATSAGTIELENAPTTRPGRQELFQIKPAAFEKEVTNIELFGDVDRVILGGGGRLALGHMQRDRRLAIVDVSEGKLLKCLTLPGPCVPVAGAHKLVLILPEQGQMQRWDLHTLEREQTALFPRGLFAFAAAMGIASDGPMLVATTTRGPKPEYGLLFIDVAKLAEMPLDTPKGPGWKVESRNFALRASADGRVFTGWEAVQAPHASFALRLAEKPPVSGIVQDAHLVPNADGSLLYSGQTIYGPDLAPLAKVMSGSLSMVDNSPWFLHMEPGKIGFCLNADRKRLAEAAISPWGHLIYVPAAGVMIQNTGWSWRIELKKFDLTAALNAAGGEYLFIDSVPVRTARRGQPYVYRVSARAKAGAVKYTLDSGPKGMTIGDDGQVQWTVAPDMLVPFVNVSISVTDGKQTVKQAYTITMR